MSILPRAFAVLFALLLLPATLSSQEAVNPLAPEPEMQADETEAEESSDIAAEPEVVTPEGVAPLTQADVDAWLDGFMPYAIQKADIAGAAVTVVKDGEILTSRGFGYADLESETPVDGYGTMFRPGSISKLFTWIAVMQQIEEGNIDLDTDINTYLDFEIPEAYGEPITMRHLMTHTPGFEEKIRNLILTDPALFESLGDFLRDTPPPGRIFPPGETPAYSNYGTAVAGYIVERVSGTPFDAYVEERIFAPMGMERATFRQPLPEAFEPYMSSGYNRASEGVAQPYELIPMGPAGSLAADGEAMGRFMIAMLERNPGVMSAETWEQFYNTPYQLSPPLNAMELGVWELDKGDLRIRGHGGDTMFFHSDLNVLIDEGVGIYVTVNSSGPGSGTLRFSLTTAFAQRYFEEASQPLGERLETAEEHGAMVVGNYETSRTAATSFAAILRTLGQETVSMNEDHDLVYSLLGEPTVWREVEPFVWRNVSGYERLTAVFDEDGALDYFTYEPVSPILHMMPAPWYRDSSLVMPLLTISLLVLLATLIVWPIRALVRRHYRAVFPHEGRAALSYLLTRIAIVLVFVFLIAWVMVFQTLLNNLSGLSGGFITQLRITQILQLLLYAALAVSLWNIWTVWTSAQSWFAKTWSIVISFSILIVIVFAATNGLLSFGTYF